MSLRKYLYSCSNRSASLTPRFCLRSKSPVATIRPERSGGAERYAPLSSGLDIVRKTLGEHEIAVRAALPVLVVAGG
jgi:hypothetical protein